MSRTEELQQLLDDLARSALEELPRNLHMEDLYGSYFSRYSNRPGAALPDVEERYWQVRMWVLTAITDCRSLHTIHVPSIWHIGEEREEEVWFLLRGLTSNPVLRTLSVERCGGLRGSHGCVFLGQLVESSRSLRKLSLSGVGLHTSGLGLLANRLRGSGLEELDLSYNKVGDAEGAQQVALILATAPQLKSLRLEGIGMDVAGAQVIGNALLSCTTLRELSIGNQRVRHASPSGSGIGPVSTVLKLALTPGDGNNACFVAGITHLLLRIEEHGETGLEV